MVMIFGRFWPWWPGWHIAVYFALSCEPSGLGFGLHNGVAVRSKPVDRHLFAVESDRARAIGLGLRDRPLCLCEE
jgi:hypothetical protein